MIDSALLNAIPAAAAERRILRAVTGYLLFE